MTNPEREEIRDAYISRLRKSWTYARLTYEERTALAEAFYEFPVYGSTKKQVTDQLNAVYYAFLCALGYNNNKMNWREETA